MNDIRRDPVDVDELMRRIAAEVAQRRALHAPAGAAPMMVPRPPLSPATLPIRDSYELSEFLALHDAAFVEAAYRGVLRRSADPQGSAHFLAALRHGEMSKVDVLGRLRYSPEGRTRAIRVEGLSTQFAMRTLYRVPVLGYLLAWFVHLVRLPNIVRNLEGFEGYGRTQLQMLYASDTAQAEAIDASLAGLHTELQRGVHRQDLDRLAGELDSLRGRLAEQADTERGGLARLESAIQGSQLRLESAIRESHSRLESAELELQSRLEGMLETFDARLGQAEQHEQTIAAAQARLGEQLGALASAQLDRAAFESRLALVDQKLEAKSDSSAVAALGERLLAVTEHKADRSLIDVLRVEVEARLTPLAGAADVDAKLGRLERLLDLVRAGQHAVNRRLERSAITEQLPEESADAPASEGQPREDFYAALEDSFRGSREDIRKRAEVFVEILERAQAGTEAAPVLDLGSGRGEWLELLRDRGLLARGVDLNGIFVSQCLELGLDVAERDALAALASQPDHSLGAITAFHLVEHLPLESVLQLFEQSLRVLKPGGVLILETPNPENLVVGTCNFYLDPTHRNPVPPLLLDFIGRHCGFPRVEIRRLGEFRELGTLADLPPSSPDAAVINPVIALVRQAWYGPPDYALVAHTA